MKKHKKVWVLSDIDSKKIVGLYKSEATACFRVVKLLDKQRKKGIPETEWKRYKVKGMRVR